MKKQNEKRKKGGIWTVILVIAICVCAYSAWQVLKIAMDYRKGTDEYAALLSAQTTEIPPQTDQEDSSAPEEQEDPNEIRPDEFRPDFTSLQEQNEDCIAWIRFPNIELSYPVMQGEDNNYYLKHTFSGEKVTAASIFMDYNNKPDFSDDNTIIYGHNMKNGSMFAKINKFADESYYQENPYFWIYTPTTIYRYEIFSCHVANVQKEEMYCKYAKEAKFAAYLNQIKEESDYPIDVEVTTEDRIATLYTCNSAGSNYRYQVHAKQAAAFDAATGKKIPSPQKPKVWQAPPADTETQTETQTEQNQEGTQNE